MFTTRAFGSATVTSEVTYVPGSVLSFLYFGVKQGIYPPLIFLGIGAMTDFSTMLSNPKLVLLGAAAQVGVFLTFLGALWLDFSFAEAGAIGIIGGADGPTAIFLAAKLAPHLLGAIAIAAYSYMALVPVIQPPIMRLLTTREERLIRMKPPRKVSKREKMIFPIAAFLISALIAPGAIVLLGMLFFGNLLKESLVTERLARTARSALIDIVTILLGFSVGASTQADTFLTRQSLLIFGLGALSFAIATAGGRVVRQVHESVLDRKDQPAGRCRGCFGGARLGASRPDRWPARGSSQLFVDARDGTERGRSHRLRDCRRCTVGGADLMVPFQNQDVPANTDTLETDRDEKKSPVHVHGVPRRIPIRLRGARLHQRLSARGGSGARRRNHLVRGGRRRPISIAVFLLQRRRLRHDGCVPRDRWTGRESANARPRRQRRRARFAVQRHRQTARRIVQETRHDDDPQLRCAQRCQQSDLQRPVHRRCGTEASGVRDADGTAAGMQRCA